MFSPPSRLMEWSCSGCLLGLFSLEYSFLVDAERSATELQRTAEFVNAIDQHPAIVNFVENPDTGYVNFQGKPFHVSVSVAVFLRSYFDLIHCGFISK